MTNESELQRMARLTRLGQRPTDLLSKHTEMMQRLSLTETASMKALRVFDDLPSQRIFKQLELLNRNSALIEATQKAMARPALIEQIEQIQKRMDSYTLAIDKAILPQHTALAEMAERMAAVTAPYHDTLNTYLNWQTKLEQQMRAVQLPWLSSNHPALSIEGFAVVSRLNTVVRQGAPYGDAERDILDEDLGEAIIVEDDAEPDDRDEAHLDAGMNPSLLAISPAGVGDVLIQTGFVLRADYAPIPQSLDGSSSGHVFHPGHGALITAVEQNLRSLIQTKMTEEYGSDWIKKRLHPNVIDGWRQRQVEAVDDGESLLDLIQYSNFMELKDIIIGKQHWSQIFGAIFKKKDHFSTSLERLHPIRRPLAHSRPIGIGQQFHLISEAGLVLRALNIDIFSK